MERKFRGHPESAIGIVELEKEFFVALERQVPARSPWSLLFHRCLEATRNLVCGGEQSLSFSMPHGRDPGKNIHEPRPPVVALFREVRSGKEGFFPGSHEDRERPASGARQELACGHVQLVDIGSLFPVDLDTDEMLVQEVCDPGIGEGFPLHDMAPVAGGVPYREKYRLVVLFRLFKCLVTPWIPVHRVVRMLDQVWTLLVNQPVCMPGIFSPGVTPGLVPAHF